MFNNYYKKKQPLCGVRSLVCFSFTVLLLYFFQNRENLRRYMYLPSSFSWKELLLNANCECVFIVRNI